MHTATAAAASRLGAARSAVLEVRRPLGQEGLHALTLVVAAEQRVEVAALHRDTVGQRHLVGQVHQLLDQGHRRSAEAVDRLGRGQGLVQQLVGRHDARHQAGALGLGGAHHAGRQQQVHGLALAHRTRQALGAAGARHDAQLDFGLAELGAVGRDDEVAHHRQLAAATQRKAGYRGDDRLAHVQDGLPVLRDQAAPEGRGEGVGQHGRDVGTGREGALGAGQHNGADAVIGVEGQQGFAQFVHQLVVQRIQGLGPVQRDQAGLARAVAVDGGQDAFIGHGEGLRGVSLADSGAACNGAPLSIRSMKVSTSWRMISRTGRYCSAGASQTSAVRSPPPAGRLGRRCQVGSGPIGVSSTSWPSTSYCQAYCRRGSTSGNCTMRPGCSASRPVRNSQVSWTNWLAAS
mmetsp:Transcript_1261/g.3657  ORF Transcript_1261/g.3657 Transcript_1261/m.3657 type:complete len:404 (+) Transcript_1261:1128-2339(+)